MDHSNQDFAQLNTDNTSSNNNNNTSPSNMEDLESGNQRRRTYFSTASNDYGIALLHQGRDDFDPDTITPAGNNSTNNGSNDTTPRTTHPPKSLGRQCRAFVTMAAPYFRSSSSGRRLFASMIVLTLLNSGIRVYFSYLARDFW